jgi:peptide/nickel transport system ATP-binding protein/oligopeptide transport system ATP-binding protein
MTDRIIIEGDVPSPENPPSGCRFHTRCHKYIGDICETDDPELLEVDDDHVCACHHHTD